MRTIDQTTMNRLFEVTDELGLSREAIEVPLLMSGEGSVRALSAGRGFDQRFEIELPDREDLGNFLGSLEAQLRELGWSGDRLA